MTVQTVSSPAKTARDALTAASVGFGLVHTRRSSGHRWLVCEILHGTAGTGAESALRSAFPGLLVQVFTGAVWVRLD